MKISSLPRKYALDVDDILPLVDTQFGPENYINKKTTVGDLMVLAENKVNARVAEISPVTSVNGEAGVVVLGLNQLDSVAISVPVENHFLVYNEAQDDWVNRNIDNIDFVLDCGSF